MGVQRKRRRREERLEEEEQEPGREPAEENVLERERPQEREATAVDRVIDLQKTAGNRATTAALSRWGLATLPWGAAPRWPTEPEAIIDGVVIPIESFSLTGGSSRGATGTAEAKAAEGGDIVVSAKLGEHSADLAMRATQGKVIKKVIIVLPQQHGKGMTITLTDVLISNYQVSNTTESWTLNFKKRELSQSPPPQAQPRP